jgi:serine/threonine protein kinase/tetratricopeptide (TPR) repeat protein
MKSDEGGAAMSDLRWRRLEEIFHRALEVPPEERRALLDAACAGDDALRREVEALLRNSDPAAERVGRVVADAAAGLAASAGANPVGTVIDAYRVVARLGEGGMGEVFLAEQDAPVHRRVALKTIKPGMDTREVLRRFEAERQSLALMNHPSIARVLDAGMTPDGRPYFVMDLVTGPPITDYCDRKRLSIAARLALFLDVLAGVQHAHLQGIIHRDIKPSNVLVEEHDGKPVPKIIDFGIAKAVGEGGPDRTLMTAQGHLVGTPAYMSPEQAGLGSGSVDTRTDVYSLGVLLYELLVGAPPHDPQSLRASAYDEMLRIIREVEPLRPSVRLGTLATTDVVSSTRGTELATLRRSLRGDLDWITLKAIEKEPARRYTTPSEMAADIRRYFDNEAVQAGPPTVRYRARKFVRRHRAAVIAASVVVMALGLGALGATIGMVRASHAEAEARRAASTADATTAFLVDLFKESYPDQARGRPPDARQILDRGAQRIETQLVDQPLVRARLSGIMGDVYRDIGEYGEADTLLHREVALLEEGGSDSLTLAAAVNRLAIFLRATGRVDSAIPLYQRALGLRERALPPDNLDVASSMNNLANAYAVSGHFDQAIPLLRRALAIREKGLPPNDPTLGGTYSNLATMLMDTEETDSARVYYQKNLRIQEAQPGPVSPGLARALYNLGGLEHHLERYEAARPLYERALAILEKVYSPEHAEVSSALLNLGAVAFHLGDYATAESTLARAHAIRVKVFGVRSSMVAKVDRAMAQLRQREGRLADSRRAYARALWGFGSATKDDSLQTATTLFQFADCLRDLKDRRAERDALVRSLQIREALLPPADPDIAEVRARLASSSSE